MKQVEIAQTYKISESLVSRIKKAEIRFTDNIDLAIDIARLTGERPLKYIKPKLRTLALAAHPELGRKVKRSA